MFEQIIHSEVVWAAIIASCLTLGGVLLTNRNNRLELIARLKHDSDQRDRERQMALKRDVYVPAIEAITKLPKLMASLADLGAGSATIYKEGTESLSLIMKIQLVATNVTVQATLNLLNEYGTSYMELMLRRSALLDRKSNIDLAQRFIDKALKEQERWVEELKQLNLSGKHDAARLNVINHNFGFEQQNFDKFTAQKNQLLEIQTAEHLQFAKYCVDKSMTLSRLIPQVLFSTRKELELELDEAEYMRQFNASMERGEEVFKNFLAQAKAQIVMQDKEN